MRHVDIMPVAAAGIGGRGRFRKLAVGCRPLPSIFTALDSKRTLLNLAARAAREVREDMLAPKGAVAAQGLGYNAGSLSGLGRPDCKSVYTVHISAES